MIAGPLPPSTARGSANANREAQAFLRSPPASARGPHRPTARINNDARQSHQGGGAGHRARTAAAAISERLYPASRLPGRGWYAAEREQAEAQRQVREDALEARREQLAAERARRKAEVETIRGEEDVFVSTFVKTAMEDERAVRRLQRSERDGAPSGCESVNSSSLRSPRERGALPAAPATTTGPTLPDALTSSAQDLRPHRPSAVAPQGPHRRSAAPAAASARLARAASAVSSNDDVVSSGHDSEGESRRGRKDESEAGRRVVTIAVQPQHQRHDESAAAELPTGAASDGLPQLETLGMRRARRDVRDLSYAERVRIGREERRAQRKAARERFVAEKKYYAALAEAERRAVQERKLVHRDYVDMIKVRFQEAMDRELARKQELVRAYRAFLDLKEAERAQLLEEERAANHEQMVMVSSHEKGVPERVDSFKERRREAVEEMRAELQAILEAAERRDRERHSQANAQLQRRRAENRRVHARSFDELSTRRRQTARVIDEASARLRREVEHERAENRQYSEAMRREIREWERTLGEQRREKLAAQGVLHLFFPTRSPSPSSQSHASRSPVRAEPLRR